MLRKWKLKILKKTGNWDLVSSNCPNVANTLKRKTWSLAGKYLGQITFRKWVDTQNSKHPNRDIKKFQNQEITGKDSICSKQLKLKKNKRNKPTYRSAEISIFFHYFSLSLQLGTINVSSMHVQNFWKVNKSLWQKRCDIVCFLLK